MPVLDSTRAPLALRALAEVNVTSVGAINETADEALKAVGDLPVICALYTKRAVILLLVTIYVADLSGCSITGAEMSEFLHDG